MRALVALGASVAVLAMPSTALAHAGKSPPVATNFSARIDGIVPASTTVEAKTVDGDQNLWLRTAPRATVLIPGTVGEPLLRFDPSGVFLNLRSLTAESDRIDRFDLKPDPNPHAAPLWHRLTSGHSYLWHEHRLHVLEPLARDRRASGPLGRWVVPLVIDGRRHALEGVLVYRKPSSAWPLIALACVLALIPPGTLAVSSAVSRRVAVVAALGAVLVIWAVRIGRELYGRPSVGITGEVEIALTSLVGAALVYGLVRRDEGVRMFVALLAGFACLYQGLTMLPVLTHAVALTALPTPVARIGVAAIFGLGGGVLAVTLRQPVRRRASA
jgi:hypothetical protein